MKYYSNNPSGLLQISTEYTAILHTHTNLNIIIIIKDLLHRNSLKYM
jgi:hypothetical protein